MPTLPQPEELTETVRIFSEMNNLALWHQTRESELNEALLGVEKEHEQIQLEIETLQKRLEQNQEARYKCLSEQQELPYLFNVKANEALLASLESDKAIIETRALALQSIEEMEQLALKEKLEDPSMAAALEEYDKFTAMVEPMLDSLPTSYRNVVLEHHEKVKEHLKPVFDLVNGSGKAIDAEEAKVAIVASIDPEKGRPTAFALFVPIEYQVYKDFLNRNEDLSSKIAYRVVALLDQVLEEIGATSAPVVYREFNGCLTIQVWLVDQDLKADIRESVAKAVQNINGDELRATKLNIETYWVSASVVAPEQAPAVLEREKPKKLVIS